MEEFCKLVKKHCCVIIMVLCSIIILLSLSNSGILSENYTEMNTNYSTPAIVLFHANWCGHCKKLMPEWNKFENNYHKKNGIHVIKLENDEHKDIMKKHEINGFPTIKYCPNGINDNAGTVYEGPRTEKGLIDFFTNCSVENFELEEADPEREVLDVQGYTTSDLSETL